MGRKRNPKYLCEWVDTLCKDWGREIRNKYLGDDGYPTRSFFATYTEGRQTGYFSFQQHVPEFLSESVRDMSREFRALDPAGQGVIFAHYVIRNMPIKEKALCLGWTVPTYYRRLRNANERLSKRLDREPEFDNRNKTGQYTSQSILSG